MPQHKRGPWSATEDQYLVHLVNLHGAHNWVRISGTIGSRSPKQCRERYHQNLKPNLNHDPITPEEGVLIEQMVAEMGKRWAEIARRLRGRSDNAVKNWWNGGMNRRRRSNNHRRQEVAIRQPTQQSIPTMNIPTQMPTGFPPQPQMQQMPPQYYPHPMYQQPQMQQQAQMHHQQQMHHQPQMHFPQHMSLPSNAQMYRQNGMIETPLASPGAFSQMSMEGAPSLASDRSSMSTRSPHNHGSPIELPPLSGNRNDRRQSAAPQINLGAPGIFASDTDFAMQNMQMPRYDEQPKQQQQQQQMLQEPFMPAQMYAQRPQPQYAQAAQRHPTTMQNFHMQQQYQVQAPIYTPQRQQVYHMQPSPLSSSVQLPKISDLSVSTMEAHRKSPMLAIDPALMHSVHGTPIPSVHTPDGSPKDKMSLSNITL